MAELNHLISPAPAGLSAAKAAAYERRRQRCLYALTMSNYEPDTGEPAAWLVAIYRGEVEGRWDSEATLAAIHEHYALVRAGYRYWLPSDRLDDLRQGYHQVGEGQAVQLLGAVYDAWQAVYTPLPLPVYGPHPVGQEPAPVPPRTFSKAERAALVDQACATLASQTRQWFEERRPGYPFPEELFRVALPGFEREVLSSYLAREINAGLARHLLVTHGEPPWRVEPWC